MKFRKLQISCKRKIRVEVRVHYTFNATIRQKEILFSPSVRLLHTQTKKVMAEWGFVSPLIAGVNIIIEVILIIGGDKTNLVEEMQAILQAFLDKISALQCYFFLVHKYVVMYT